jgi:hypothetical protein
LPQPDSPTREKVSPLAISMSMPSTACTIWRGRPSSARTSQGAETSK